MTAAAKFNPADQRRRSMIGKVQIARKELGLDEDTYRAMLKRITGVESCTVCSDGQLADVLDELKAKGWTPKVIAGSAPRKPVANNKQADHPAARKARAMWISLYQLGVVKDRRESALEAFAARQLKVDRLQWADQGQLYKLIEALKAMAERAGWSQAGSLEDIKARLADLVRRRQSDDAG